MLSIQQVGSEILTNHPRTLYVFGGFEYGIKQRYLSILAAHYHNVVEEHSTVQSVISSISAQKLMLPQPKLYIVRYDSEFVSNLNDSVAKRLQQNPIRGTLVCIYEDAKVVAKIDKFLPDATTIIPDVGKSHIFKYLKDEFCSIDDRLLQLISAISRNYGHARNIAMSVMSVDARVWAQLTDAEIQHLFGVNFATPDDLMKKALASRNLAAVFQLLDNYPSIDTMFYLMFSTWLELDKLKHSKYSESILKPYINAWTNSDINNMIEATYETLKLTRTYSVSQLTDIFVQLLALVSFSPVPKWVEVNHGS